LAPNAYAIVYKRIFFYLPINILFQGPICRHQLRQEDECHVSYNLEEAARLFQLIKNTIDWSTIKLLSASDVNDAQNNTLEIVHRDEVYARRLQAELNRENTNEARRRTQVPSENQALPAQEITTGLPVLGINQPAGRLKNCGHRCDLVSTRQCCTCSGKIDIAKDYILYSLILLLFESGILQIDDQILEAVDMKHMLMVEGQYIRQHVMSITVQHAKNNNDNNILRHCNRLKYVV